MASKSKRVTYNDPIDDADYLEPLQFDPNAPISTRIKPTKKATPPTGVFGSIFLPFTLLLYAGVPISQFVIGFIYIGQCTIQQFIALYMILSGFFGIAFVVVGLIIYMKIVQQSSSDDPRSKPMIVKILIPIFIVLLLFVIAWFFTGQVVVFEVKLRVELFDPVLPEYCHPNLYKAAYVLIFVDYLIFLIGIILNVMSCMSPAENNDNKKTKRPTRNTRK
jgi:NAD/NADP transhydrogenase beta subunit